MTRITMKEAFTVADRMKQVGGKPKKVANNTFHYHRLPDRAEVYRLHLTDIVTKYKDGRVELNSGGWKTVTTKDRINTYSPYRVYSVKGEWCVSDGDKEIPFRDGMILPDAFSDPAFAKPTDNAKLGKAITKFVKRLDGMTELPKPSNGDCWFCLMMDQEPSRDPSEPSILGWTTTPTRPTTPCDGSEDHLREHIKDGYLHGSLIVNAMRWAGYKDRSIAVHYQMDNRTTIKSALRRYLRRRLGLAT